MGALLREALVTALVRSSRPRSLLLLLALSLALNGGIFLLAAPFGASLTSRGYGPSELLAPGGAALVEVFSALRWGRLESRLLFSSALLAATVVLLRAFLFFLAGSPSRALRLAGLLSTALALTVTKLVSFLLSGFVLGLVGVAIWYWGDELPVLGWAPFGGLLVLCLSRPFELAVGVAANQRNLYRGASGAWMSIFPSALRHLRHTFAGLFGIGLVGLAMRGCLLATTAEPIWSELRADSPWGLLAIAQLSLGANLWVELFSATLATITQPSETVRLGAEEPSSSAL